jgi:hypothetical protein
MSGYWVAPSGFLSRDNFYDYCKSLHSDEEDPKLKFYGGPLVPDCWTTDSVIDSKMWEWLALPEPDRNAVAAYLVEVYDGHSIERILGNLIGSVELGRGKFSREKSGWMYDYLDKIHFFDGWSDTAKNYFDLETYLCEQGLEDVTFVEYEGMQYVFSFDWP